MTRYPEIGSEALEYRSELTEKVFNAFLDESIEVISSNETVPIKNNETEKKFENGEF